MAMNAMARASEVTIDRDPEVSFTLPGRLYHDPAVFEDEKRRIFARSWHYACPAADVARPGDYAAVELIDQAVLVIRGRDGALRAARNSGHVEGFDKAAFGLQPVRLEEQMGLVFVNLDSDAPSLAEMAGDMFADMRAHLPWWDELVPFRDERADVGFEFEQLSFNWKVLIDNCLECYHCEPAHPAFCDLIDMGSYRTTTHRWWSAAKSRLRKHDNAAYRVAEDSPSQRGDFWYLWPNLTFGVLPGQASFLVFIVEPAGPETTLTKSDYFYRPGDAVSPARAEYGRDVLWAEDKAICESVHRGLKSLGYRQGRFIVDAGRSHISEPGVHHFQTLDAEAMGLI